MIRFRSTNPQIRIALALEHQGDLSRQQLVDITGIPRPRLSAILQEMLRTGALAVSERIKAESRGRPTELLTLNIHMPQYVGISLQHHTTCITVANTLFHPIFEAALPAAAGEAIEQRLANIWKVANTQARASGVSLDHLVSVGCALPGLLPEPMIGDRPSTAIESARIATAAIENLTGITPVICSTTPAAAIAEARSQPQLANCLYVRVSDGVGAALILDHVLMTGARNVAGELGHIPAFCANAASECACGKSGCLETVVSTPALCEHFGVDTIHAVAEAWTRNADGAREHLRQAAHTLGAAIATAVLLTDPGQVFLSWSLAHQIPELLGEVREGMRANLLPALRDAVKLAPAVMPEATAAALGAAVWPSAVSAEIE